MRRVHQPRGGRVVAPCCRWLLRRGGRQGRSEPSYYWFTGQGEMGCLSVLVGAPRDGCSLRGGQSPPAMGVEAKGRLFASLCRWLLLTRRGR